MRTILLIEDDKDMRENTAEILELANYRVLKAENGRKGVELAKQHMPDLILCDIMMPELDGFSLCARLKADSRTCRIPLVLVTALDDMDSKVRGL